MNVKYHYVRYTFKHKEVTIQYIKSEDNVADFLTKCLPHNVLRYLRDFLMEPIARLEIESDSDEEEEKESPDDSVE